MRLFVFCSMVWLAVWAARAQESGSEATGFREPAAAEVTTDDGTVALAWNGEGEGVVYEVRRWTDGGAAEGVLVYEGEDTGTFLSGLPEDVFEIAIRSREQDGVYGEWPEERLTLTVDYIDMSLVAGLMGAGLVTFLAIVGTIVFGHLRHRDVVLEKADAAQGGEG